MGDFQVEHALETVRFLRPEILQFVREYGAESAAYFDRVIAIWHHGSLEERVAFVRSCSDDPPLRRAWSIVHAAGKVAAPLIPHAVRWYYRKGAVDERA